MLHTLRKLAREIHRRSLWQVLAAYLALCFVVFELVAFLTAALGLPLWTPTMALILLGVGLPVVVATAVVQGGLPGLRIVDLMDPNELEGRSPEEVHVLPEVQSPLGMAVFTWRNAVLGGVMAAALLVTSVVAYLAMWAFGIGPVGSLAAQGILEPGDRIVVTDFGNGTGQPDLGSDVRGLLEAALARSTFVEVLRSAEPGGASTVREAPVPVPPTALAGSMGARLMIDGEVQAVEGGYRVYARIRLPDGTVIGGFGRIASGLGDIGEQVAWLSSRLRERFGEPLREIHGDRG